MEEELQAAFSVAEVQVELIAGSDGVYEINVDGKNIFSKKQLARFPDDGEIVGLMQG